MEDDFVVAKIDMRNAFNLVSRQAFLDECVAHFSELLPGAMAYSILWHPMGQISSQSGVQQGDPLGPLLFSLVLHKIASAVDFDDEWLNLIFQAWFLDDGVIADRRSDYSVLFPSLTSLILHLVFIPKCELLADSDTSSFLPP